MRPRLGGADTGAFTGLATSFAGNEVVELETSAPSRVPADRAAASCVPSSTRLCLLGGRFQVEVKRGGVSQGAVQLTDPSGVFWFYDPQNAEVPVKVLDARVVNGKFWVFFGSLTDQSYQVVVTDTVSGTTNTYTPPGAYCGTADINAF